MPIDHDENANEPEVWEIPGARRRTPPGGGDRLYNDCAPSCEIAEATTDDFHAMSVVKKRGVPSSFEAAAVHMVVSESLDNWDYLCGLHPTDPTPGEFGDDKPSRRAQMVAYRDISLTRAANRGTGAHAYMEARIEGRQPDWNYAAEMGSLEWLAAVENFLDREQPEAVLVETVAFDREHMVAGTVDALIRLPRFGLTEVDWKSRTGKEKRYHTHTRRPEEAIQLGGYHKMLTKGYYMNDRGRRQRIEDALNICVVTFGPDGSYAIHEVDPEAAERGYELAVQMWRSKNLKTLMPAKAIYSDDFDPNPLLKRAIDNVPDDAPEKMELSLAWKQAGFGRPSEGEVDASRYGEAMHLIYRVTAQHQPFVGDNPEPVAIVPADVVGELSGRMAGLPDDIQAEAIRNSVGLPHLASLRMTQADVDDWDRVLRVAEEAHTQRQREAINVYQMARSFPGAIGLLPPDIGTWTDRDLTLATAVLSALMTDEVDLHGGTAPSVQAELDRHDGKKAGVKKLAKTKAGELGLTCPSRWDDIVADPVLWAVLVAT